MQQVHNRPIHRAECLPAGASDLKHPSNLVQANVQVRGASGAIPANCLENEAVRPVHSATGCCSRAVRRRLNVTPQSHWAVMYSHL